MVTLEISFCSISSFGGIARNFRLYYDHAENSHYVGKKHRVLIFLFRYFATIFRKIHTPKHMEILKEHSFIAIAIGN